MTRSDGSDERTQGRSTGGSDRLPPIDDLPGLDEGPMRRELVRQIAALEGTLSRLVVNNAPHRPARTSPTRGPAILSTAELEQVRDELLAEIARLRGEILQCVEWELDERRVGTRWTRLGRRRSSPSK
jgi:hypothetical protein